jgi:hypothetical protein
MVEKARANALAVGIGNVEFHRGEAHRLPVGDGSVDVVISNGVFNLCPDKLGSWPRSSGCSVRAAGSRRPTSCSTIA